MVAKRDLFPEYHPLYTLNRYLYIVGGNYSTPAYVFKFIRLGAIVRVCDGYFEISLLKFASDYDWNEVWRRKFIHIDDVVTELRRIKRMEIIEKCVDFWFCNHCVNKELSESEDPCDDCLNNFVNSYSHKPVHFKDDGSLQKESINELSEKTEKK